MDKNVLFQGAESRIYIEEQGGRNVLVKERFEKKYRNPQLDSQLTRERMKAESKNMLKVRQTGVKTPEVYKMDLEKRTIHMEYFKDARTTKDVINELQASAEETDKQALSRLTHQMGEDIAKIHARGITHGDLTTSNMLVDKKDLIFIDFGLSSAAASFEDKGVDLYVLERALLSTHQGAEDLFAAVLEAYRKQAGEAAIKVLSKFEEVRARGRKRTMVG